MTTKTQEQIEEENKAQEALDQIKAVYQDGYADINGRRYVFTKANHRKRLRIFGYFMSIQDRLLANDLSFVADPDFEEIETLMFGLITYDNSALNKMPMHFEENDDEKSGDYLVLITVALSVFSYPFLKDKS